MCGPLEFHASPTFDSTDDILERLEEGLANDDCKAVVMCFDSPGGDAQGVVEAHRKIKRLSKQYGKPIYGFVNESCYSAAYGLGSACEELWIPDTGSAGSIGVIATLQDTTKKLAMEGIKVRFVTTGARKTDLRPERPLTDDIIDTIQETVDEMAEVFFTCVGKGRGLSLEEIVHLQAGRLMGKKAVKAGLADGISSYDSFIRMVKASIDSPDSETEGAPKGTPPNPKVPQERPMATLLSLIAAQDEALKAVTEATTPKAKKAALAAFAAAVSAVAEMKTTKKIKHEENTVTDDDGDEEEDEEETAADDDSDDSDDDDSDDGDDEDDSDDDEDDDEEEDEEEEEKAAKAFVGSKKGAYTPKSLFQLAQKITGKKGASEVFGALTAIQSRVENAEKVEARLGKLENSGRKSKVDALISDARKAGKLTKKMIPALRAQGMKDFKFLKAHLAALPKLVRDHDEEFVPGMSEGGAPTGAPDTAAQLAMMSKGGHLNKDQEKILNAAMANLGEDASPLYAKTLGKVAGTFTNGTNEHGKPRV